MVGDEAVIEPAAVADARPLLPGIEVLQQIGHAGERAGRQAGADGGARLVIGLLHDGIDAGIDGLDALDRCVQDFLGRHLFLGDQLAEAEGVVVGVLLEGGHACGLLTSMLGWAAGGCY